MRVIHLIVLIIIEFCSNQGSISNKNQKCKLWNEISSNNAGLNEWRKVFYNSSRSLSFVPWNCGESTKMKNIVVWNIVKMLQTYKEIDLICHCINSKKVNFEIYLFPIHIYHINLIKFLLWIRIFVSPIIGKII